MLSFKPGFQDNEVYESGVKNEDDEVIMADNEAYGNFGLPNNDEIDDDDGDQIVMHIILVNNKVNLKSHNPSCWWWWVFFFFLNDINLSLIFCS